MTPVLLRPGISRQVTTESLLRTSMTEGVFGSLAVALNEPATIGLLESINRDAASWPAETRVAWEGAVAREILLAAAWKVPAAEDAGTFFRESHPFSNAAPPLGDLLGREVAVSAFPLDHGRPEDIPPWTALFLVEGNGEDMRARLADWDRVAFSPGNARVFFQTSRPGLATIPGASWTLAAHLAMRMLEENDTDRRKHRRELALDWMLTGEVDAAGGLRRIGVGNKLNLRTSRKWLFPIHNRGEVIGQADHLSDAFFPPTLDAAWSLLTGEGSVDGRTDVRWPARLESFHTITSFAWGPIMASILLAAPRRVALWHSSDETSLKRAEVIRELFQPGFWTDDPPQVDLEPLDSASLPKAERQLRPRLLDDLAPGKEVLFNFTNGNRIMGLAPHGFAKSHPNLWLIYRDANKKPFEYELIRYKGVHPTAERIAAVPADERGPAAREIPDKVWDGLFETDRDKQPAGNTAEAMRTTLGGREVGKKVKFTPEIPRT